MSLFTNQATAPARIAPPCSRPAPTILVAEDSADGREMMLMLLGLKGYKVLCAEDGQVAVDLALLSLPDLILLDLDLPRLDGLGVTRNLRSHQEFKGTAIVIISGHDPIPYRQFALEAGCTDYLLKPIDFDHLDVILKARVPLN